MIHDSPTWLGNEKRALSFIRRFPFFRTICWVVLVCFTTTNLAWAKGVGLTPLNLHAISPILKLPPQKAQPSITAEKVKNENGIPLNVENNSLLINPSLTKEFYPNDGDLFLETKNQVKEKVHLELPPSLETFKDTIFDLITHLIIQIKFEMSEITIIFKVVDVFAQEPEVPAQTNQQAFGVYEIIFSNKGIENHFTKIPKELAISILLYIELGHVIQDYTFSELLGNPKVDGIWFFRSLPQGKHIPDEKFQKLLVAVSPYQNILNEVKEQIRACYLNYWGSWSRDISEQEINNLGDNFLFSFGTWIESVHDLRRVVLWLYQEWGYFYSSREIQGIFARRLNQAISLTFLWEGISLDEFFKKFQKEHELNEFQMELGPFGVPTELIPFLTLQRLSEDGYIEHPLKKFCNLLIQFRDFEFLIDYIKEQIKKIQNPGILNLTEENRTIFNTEILSGIESNLESDRIKINKNSKGKNKIETHEGNTIVSSI